MSDPGPLKLQVTPLVPAPLTVIVTLWPVSTACVAPDGKVSEIGFDPLLHPETKTRRAKIKVCSADDFMTFLRSGAVSENGVDTPTS